jgi:putative transport protein
MTWLFDTLRQYPEIAIFLALALGFWLGQMRFGKFSLGVVTSTLLAGVLIGQIGITISPHVKSVFFLMFLFAVGYGVGPQFFRGLRSDGLQQVLFATLLCVLCLLTTFFVARAMDYHTGFAAGLLAGACTISAVLGVAADTINQLGVSPEQKKLWIESMPVAYAVAYLYGTAGSAWVLATLGPKLLRVDLAAECRKLEASMGASEAEPGVISAYQRFVVRAYRLTDDRWTGKDSGGIRAALRGQAALHPARAARRGGGRRRAGHSADQGIGHRTRGAPRIRARGGGYAGRRSGRCASARHHGRDPRRGGHQQGAGGKDAA